MAGLGVGASPTGWGPFTTPPPVGRGAHSSPGRESDQRPRALACSLFLQLSSAARSSEDLILRAADPKLGCPIFFLISVELRSDLLRRTRRQLAATEGPARGTRSRSPTKLSLPSEPSHLFWCEGFFVRVACARRQRRGVATTEASAPVLGRAGSCPVPYVRIGSIRP